MRTSCAHPLIRPLIGVVSSFKYALLLHGVSLVYLATVTSSSAVFMGMPFLAAGASGMPILLGYLTEQVRAAAAALLQDIIELYDFSSRCLENRSGLFRARRTLCGPSLP